jgi:quercetin dioxygenase-like cupin family protein
MNEIPFKEVKSDAVKDTFIKVLVGKEEGWGDYVMRLLELKKEGYSPFHKHPWPHINFVVEGTGEIEIDGVVFPLEPGSYAYVDSNKMHQFRNIDSETFKFICIVPKEGHVY